MDLFVRASNRIAIEMYKAFGYIVYRQVRAMAASLGKPRPAPLVLLLAGAELLHGRGRRL